MKYCQSYLKFQNQKINHKKVLMNHQFDYGDLKTLK